MVTPFDDFAGNGGTHYRGAQRQKVYSGVHHGKHGGTQTGRVLLHADLQRSLDEDGGGSFRQARGHSGWAGRDSAGCTVSASFEMTALSGRERSGSPLRSS